MTFPAAPSATFGPPPTPYPASQPADPTNVMGRRTLAWLIDLILFFGLVGVLFSQLAVQDTFGNTCQQLQDGNITNVCMSLNDDAVYLDNASDSTILNLFSLGWFVGVFILLQGFTGGSPGKLICGLRVVDKNGRRCGPIKSMIRSMLWVVDAAPWFIPGLVGFVTGLTSTGHRRVGDMAASTYVVAKSSVGTPISVGGATGIPNYAPTGPQSAYGTAWAPNPAAPVSTPMGQPTWDSPPPMPQPQQQVPQPWSTAVTGSAAAEAPPPLPDASASPDIPAIPDLPHSPDVPDTTDATAVAHTAPASAPEPQWDAARNTYIQWDAAAGHWLAWDDATQRWNPI